MRPSAAIAIAVTTVAVLLGGTATASARPSAHDLPRLPAGFSLGVATSGFQVEGDNRDSNWLRYSDSGRVPERVGRAVDFHDRYAQDIALARATGATVFRFSVEWSRVQPAPGRFDPAGWAFYDRVVRAVVDAGMQPMITLNHWVHPGWEVDRGGWNRPGMADDMVAFGEAVIDRYAWARPSWVTFNEPTEYVRREVTLGGLAPSAIGIMTDGIVRAHRALYRHVHARQRDAVVTSNIAYLPIPGVEPFLEDVFPARTRTTLDVIGVDQYYSVSAGDVSASAAATGEFWRASQAPEAMYLVLRRLSQRFPGIPLYVVENGLATDPSGRRPDGYRRSDHLRDTVYWLQRAIAASIPVVGYNYWSLTDNYEWGAYTPRFGLYTVDATTDPTLTRRPTDGVAAFRRIAADRGVPNGYRPTRAPVACSLVAAPDSCVRPVTVP
ncbi:family 1 glycosylhydrolase [Williamsia deligens]|uniref:beta-glucosidase n=1 Tax=Williamsia deligens TaxID=321325 RepID=A0ABW3G0H3_9NOCA|nr:family 1 glycosylhydrolase [Williamsia deligens]MCP2195059.1 beta-glucosidase [Williamsia deligens]